MAVTIALTVRPVPRRRGAFLVICQNLKFSRDVGCYHILCTLVSDTYHECVGLPRLIPIPLGSSFFAHRILTREFVFRWCHATLRSFGRCGERAVARGAS